MQMKKSRKQKKLLLLFLFVILIVFFFVSPKYVQRYFYWNFADINDYQKFDKLDIKKGESTFLYHPVATNHSFRIPTKFIESKNKENFVQFLENHKTLAFLAIRNDSLLYESYFSGFDENSVLSSFSVAKSFVSALVGIAIDEGYIYSTSQSITFFLKELQSPEFDKITIEDLLNMRSGIDFNEGYTSPFADAPKYYYGTDLEKYITKLKIKEPPNLHYDYISVNTLLLSLIVERATNTKLNVYLEKKIWQPLGMEAKASWSVDSKENNTIKSFCCINGMARDFAKFGSLYLNNGYRNGKQIVPTNWVERSTQIKNDSRDSQDYPYTYQWRVLENGCYFAKGILGQYIFVNPDKNLVFVRMGKNYGDVDWADFCLSLSDQL